MDFNADSIMTFIETDGLDWGVKVLGAIAIYWIGKRIVRFLSNVARKVMGRAKMDDILVSFLGNIIYGIGLAFVIIAALSNLGIETTSLAAVIAAAGLAIGLALQGSLSNFAAGVMIIAFRPFKKGDFVEVAGTAGTVTEVSIFNTILRTPDNKTIIVPNGNITSDNIINYSANDTRRVDMKFGIGYDDDLLKAKTLLGEILAADERILKDPEPVVAVAELGDSSVNFVVRPWVKSADYWAVNFDLHEKVKLAFDAAGISIPFPQQDVHMYHVDVPSKQAA